MFDVQGAAKLALKYVNSAKKEGPPAQKPVQQEGIGFGVSKQQDDSSLPKADFAQKMQELQAKQARMQAELNNTQNKTQDTQIKRNFERF